MELKTLEAEVGLRLECVQPDWGGFKAAYGLQYGAGSEAVEAADRHWFRWQTFRGMHRPNACLLDEEGHISGLIIKDTELQELRLPALPALQYLCICDNQQLASLELGEDYPQLQHLDLSSNALKKFEWAGNFPSLAYLNLSRNQLKRLQHREPDGMLPSLNHLDLSNNQMKNWNTYLLDKLPALESVFLSGNPLNESVTVYRREEEDSNYLRSLRELRASYGDQEPLKNNEYKVLVIGDGKAGKSCMIHRLVENEFLEHWDSTHGIAVKPFNPAKEERFKGFKYILNLWDFGGQDIYHHTHRLFLQSNATYLLLWNKETEFNDFVIQQTSKGGTHRWKNRKLAYWLDYVRYLGRNSPVVVAQTKAAPDSRSDRHPDMHKLRERYENELPYLSPFLQIDARPADTRENGYERLLDELENAIEELEREEYLPPHWVSIREQLDEMKKAPADSSPQKHTLDFRRYLDLALAAGERNPEQLLNNWLVPTGVVFYKKGLFDDKLILNQEWAIRAVYALYNREGDSPYYTIKEDKGRFDGSLLSRCWSGYSAVEQQWFLDFMLQAELCFEINTGEERPWEQREFIAIEMLDDRRSEGLKNQLENWEAEALCHLRYCYPFLHLGVIQSFIVRTHRLAGQVSDIYKSGLMIKVEGAKVIVEAHQDAGAQSGHISVTVPAGKVALLQHIRKEFEAIHSDQEIAQQVRPGTQPWVDWKVLNENAGQPNLPTAEGNKAVAAAPYLVFLPDAQGPPVPPVSELPQEEANFRDIALDDYPKGAQVIEVPMAADAAAKPSLYELPKPIRLLYLTATPKRLGQINTGLESRFKDVIREYDKEGRIEFSHEPGLSKERFRHELFDKDPHIIHFGGHGFTEGLALEDANINAEVLVELISLLENTRLVVLNACHTLPMARELAKYVPYVVGTQGPLADEAAIVFARNFYVGIAGGKDIEKSFKYALVGIKDAGAGSGDIPVLVKGVK